MSNNIKELLKKPNVTLDEVLKESEIVNEYKEQKEYVVKFFNDPEFQTLLKYLNKDHNKLEEKKKAFQFPQTACEIFASATKQVVDFFQQQKDNKYINFQSLFEEFFDSDAKIKTKTINYTRAGYVQKIVNSLILKDPQFFAQCIYDDDQIFKALLQHSYSSSVTSILIALILNVQKNELQDENNKNNQVAFNEWLQKTQQFRVNYVKQILEEIISKEEEYNFQKKKNLGLILASIFKGDFSEKDEILKMFFEEYFDKFADNFLDNFFEPENQVSGTVFNIGLNYLQENKDQQYFTIDKLKPIVLKYFDTLNKYVQVRKQTFSRKTSTFSKEVIVTNNNLYKFVSALAKFFDILISKNELEVLQKNQIGENIVHLYIKHPFNNVLHFKITQVLQKVINTNQNDLIGYYFFQNVSFKNLLNQIVQEYKVCQENQAMVSSCYFGFIKELHESLQSKGSNRNQDDDYYDSFITEFVNKEANKENSIFTDIDNENNTQEVKAEFDFSIEQIQQKFAEFLGLEDHTIQEMQKGNDDDGEEEEEEEQEVEEDQDGQEQEEEEDEEQNEVINSQELREELKNVMDQEETAFQDFKYWKKQDLHDIDNLISEYDI